MWRRSRRRENRNGERCKNREEIRKQRSMRSERNGRREEENNVKNSVNENLANSRRSG